jgi:hypothetical protein
MKHEFTIVFDRIELTEEEERALRHDLQRVVADHVVRLDRSGDDHARVLVLEDGSGGGRGTQGMVIRRQTVHQSRD